MTETQHIAIVAEFLDAIGVLWCHVPNEGQRSIRFARTLQRIGLKSGVPDILIFRAPPLQPACCGTAVEMKRPSGGKASKNQLAWLNSLACEGWYVFVGLGADHAIGELQKLGYGVRP